MQMRLREKELETEVRLKELEAGGRRESSVYGSKGQDPLKLIPPFDEGAVSQFFERIARGHEWPREKWSTFAQTAQKGKALKACDTLSFE
ncbi:hypothetical protein Pcinc_000013 [Petrolisthes cinctipes]|uniref:Uncharacterized protein n=1 Tax=Petrolisthes cinctipes TaxID=88211 RepID=A0AAE1GQI7_PETCI|nr:hypothetical protein Pcinc_000013 [Petrolisthes cinctipes]